MTEKSLKWGYWWVNNRAQLARSGTIALAVVAFLMLAYGGYGFYDWFFGHGVAERQVGRVLGQPDIPTEVIRKTRLQPLAYGSADLIEVNGQTSDLYVEVTNPNPHAWAEFDYYFADGENQLGQSKHDFILPSSTKNLYQLGVKGEGHQGAQMRFSSLVWHRVDKHVTGPDIIGWMRARLNLRLEDVAFRAPELTDPVPVGRATFKIVNDTAYSFWRLGFFVRLIGSSRDVGVNYVTISELRAGQSRTVEASWFNDLPTVREVQVMTDVNIFDPGVFIPPGR